MTSHYDVLGVRPAASAEQIKRAYYRKARAYHPDSHAGSASPVLAEAQRAMASLNAAWNVLRDPVLREEYDQALERSKQPTPRKPKRARQKREERAPRLEIGSGFHYWMGSLGTVRSDGEHRSRLSLVVDGAKDLAPLQTLAPDGLFALHAAGQPIHDRQLMHLQGLTGLQMLDLSRTRVTDAGLVHLQGLERLEHLALWDTALTDAGVALLGKLTALRHLGIGNTRITDAGLAGLANLGNLRVLQLWGTDVQGSGLEHLHGLIDLEIVSLPWRVRGRSKRRLKAALPGTLFA